MKTIVLAEKPSVGRELAKVLGCEKKNRSYIEGPRYIVSWAMGHLVELSDPGEYKTEWKSWKLESLPMLPEKMKLKVIGKTSSQFRVIKSLFQRKDVSGLVVATDAGREGELVARLIMRLGGWKKPFTRLWISSQTDAAIKQGFDSLKNGHEYDNLMKAAECRAEADWIVGLNVSRALTCFYDARLSAGRVQTPTLAMITRREEERRSFKPKNFFSLHAPLTADNEKICMAGVVTSNGNNRFFDQVECQRIADEISNKEIFLDQYSSKQEIEPPPLAYDLTELQRDANKILNFTAKRTLQVLQVLYERYKIVSYPRTDSRHLTSDMEVTLKDRLAPLKKSRYADAVKELCSKGFKPGKRLIDDKKVSDHHAIIPTGEYPDLQRMTTEELSLWDLISRRYVTVLMPPAHYNKIKLSAKSGDYILSFSGKKYTSSGWKKLEGKGGDSDFFYTKMDQLKPGFKVKVHKVEVRAGKTQPPARYNEASLLSAMENPSHFTKEKELKESISGGLGTPATRADIIEKLIKSFSVERRGKELVPTSAGEELIRLVPEQLKSPELTAKWELRLRAIEKGQESPANFSKDIRANTISLVSQIKNSKEKFQPRNIKGEPCPMCGKPMMVSSAPRGGTIKTCISFSCGYQEELDRNGGHKKGRREQAMNRKLINQYSSKDEGTFTLGDMLKQQMKK